MTHRTSLLLSLATVLAVTAPLTVAQESSSQTDGSANVTSQSPASVRAQLEEERERRLLNDRNVQRTLRVGADYHRMLKEKHSVRDASARAALDRRLGRATGGAATVQKVPGGLIMILLPEHPQRPSWLPREARWVQRVR